MKEDNAMARHIGAREARNKFADLLGSVHYGSQVVIIERSGKPMAAVIPVEMYQQLIAEREARFDVLDQVRSRLPDVPSEEVERDVAEAVAAVRAADVPRPPSG
jgi:prevent-host-death family protein